MSSSNDLFFRVFCGPMWGGKTKRLLDEVNRLKIKGMIVKVFKPQNETRYSDDLIVSHDGKSCIATPVKNGGEIIDIMTIEDTIPNVVAIDEAFMLQDSAAALVTLYKMNISVLVSSIDLSAFCIPFPEMEKILCWATHIEKCPAVCVVCKNDAYYTQNLEDEEINDENIPFIKVGGEGMYAPVCHQHHSFFKN